jgi:hypothetical protein
MKIRLAKSTLMVSSLLAMAGCSPDSIASPPVGEAASLNASEGNAGSTSGGGEIAVTAPLPAVGPADLQFSAVQHGNGKVTGTFRMVRYRAGFLVDFAGEVTCVSFDPVNHRAWIGGVVTANNSTDPNHSLAIHQPGRDVWFRVQDNGEGIEAAPDRSSVLGFEGAGGVVTSTEYCQRQLWAAGNANTFELVRGNIQVR